ncbi:lung seven transmembrane receptor-domain-containing protein [Flagelloscypha sp. PMI_526]|nr:lung seven transmembrane receptor-domain-containing protein [Flagelloscypha sp. PMI_526]
MWWLTLSLLGLAAAYDVSIDANDWSRQICSGMYHNEKTYINVTFDSSSQGHVAMVIYEWEDAPYLGKVTNPDPYLPEKTYVCTSDAFKAGFCAREDLGKFILDLPPDHSANQSSFWTASVSLPNTQDSSSRAHGFWIPPDGVLPKLPPQNGTVNWRRSPHDDSAQAGINPSPEAVYNYHVGEPIHYEVRKTGYYCVAVVPVTVLNDHKRENSRQEVPFHPEYKGNVHFQNAFNGQLPATDYPKVTFYTVMFCIYIAVAAGWAFLCWRHVNELLPIQYYLSGLVGVLVIEMVANVAYYRYLNSHGKGTASTILLIVVAIFDAGRNSMSFFLLLIVSLGLSVVRESLGRLMIRCQVLAGFHFIFGILYAVGIVELELESTSAFILLIFVIPLAFTLSGFLLWIMYSLNATIAQLKARKQKYKLSKFTTLYRILLLVVAVIAIFFVVSSFTFSGRLAEDYAANSWRVRWWLLDGWLALTYFAAFCGIAWLWRPSEGNVRLIMSDELAQDEEDAEDYDMEALEHRSRLRDDDEQTLVGGAGRPRGPDTVGEDDVVFEIGDDGDDDDEPTSAKKRGALRLSGEQDRADGTGERQGLMSSSRDD